MAGTTLCGRDFYRNHSGVLENTHIYLTFRAVRRDRGACKDANPQGCSHPSCKNMRSSKSSLINVF